MQISRGKVVSAQKFVVYGPEGIGKSTFASQFPDPVFIDTEGSTKKLDVARTPRPSSWTLILEQVKYFKANPQRLKTLVIDTADWAEQLCMNELCAKSHKSGIEDFGYGKGYIYLAEEFGRLLNLLEDIVELGVNVVFTAHAQMRKFEQPDEMGAYDRWEMKLQKKTAPLLKEWADTVIFANYKTYVVKADENKKTGKAQGGKRVMYTSHHPCWDAKNRDGLAEELPFSFSEIQHCIPAVEQSQQSKPVQTIVNPEAPKEVQQVTQTAPPETPREEPPKPEPPKEDPPKIDPGPHDFSGIPKALADLMGANQVAPWEIQQAVASKGYYPQDTPIENYDPSFIDGVLVGAWSQVFQIIQTQRKPF